MNQISSPGWDVGSERRGDKRGDRAIGSSCPPLPFSPWYAEIPQSIVKTLRALPSHGTNEYLFPSRPTARCPEPKRPYHWDFGKQFRALAKAAGIQNVRIHDLRHAGATILMTLGVPRPDSPEGHRTPLTRARALPAPDAGAARVDREPDRDRAISRKAGQEGTRKWHTYRHSARQACHGKT